jgi:uncharacterized protein involved in exopolysaccharide biosynthesis
VEIAEVAAQLQQAATASLGAVHRALDLLEQRDEALRIQMADFPEIESRMASLEAQVRIDQESHQFILSQLYQAQIARGAAAPYVRVFDPATGASPGHVSVVLGGLLGLMLGIGAAFSLAFFDRAAVAADQRWMENRF